MIVAQARAAAMMDHLEHRGFLINKITVRCLPKKLESRFGWTVKVAPAFAKRASSSAGRAHCANASAEASTERQRSGTAAFLFTSRTAQ
jgi:hypothetical protein